MDDVVVVGGSFAGLTAAMHLVRARRSVTILDTGLPRNRYAVAAHNLIGFDGVSPLEIRAKGLANVLAYPTARHVEAEATGIGGVTGKWADTDILLLTSLSSLRLKLQQAVAKKQVITAGTSPQLPWTGETTKNGLPLSHAYSVLDFDPKTDMVTVRNPWGQTEVSDGHGPRDGVNDGTLNNARLELNDTGEPRHTTGVS